MSQKNQISFKISETDLTEIKASIANLQEKLLPHLAFLSPEERQDMLKMGDKTIGFVQKSLEYCQSNPDLVPPYIDVAELKVDVAAIETLRSLFQPISQMYDGLSDTMALSGSESFATCLMFYGGVKNAKRQDVPKAETIYNDLSVRFPGRPSKKAAGE